MDSTIIIEKSVIILVVLRLQCLWLCILRLLKGKLQLGFKIVLDRAGKGGFYNLADGLKLFSKKNLNQIPKQIFVLYWTSNCHEYGIDD
jgi:hypothetical protein